MLNELLNVLKPTYWLTFNPPSVSGALGIGVFVFFIILVGAGIFARIKGKRKDADRYYSVVAKHISSMLITMGLIGAVLFFFSYEQVRFFGARFWYLIWIVVVAVWIYWTIRFIKRNIPAMKKQDLERKERNKYLPNTKRKQR